MNTLDCGDWSSDVCSSDLLCNERNIRAIRLFQDMTGWTPHYVADPVNEGYQPMCFSPREVAGEPIRFTAPVRP
jgi:hypothetical protein